MEMKSNTEFIKSVKFFAIIYIFCILLSVINGIGDGDFIKIIIVSFMPYFLGCYIPYIGLKFLGFLFSGFKWSYGGGFQLLPILILIIFYFLSFSNM